MYSCSGAASSEAQPGFDVTMTLPTNPEQFHIHSACAGLALVLLYAILLPPSLTAPPCFLAALPVVHQVLLCAVSPSTPCCCAQLSFVNSS